MAAPKKNIATVSELKFALAFLKAVGADNSNVYLITAVVAWMRQESGSKYLGNNPFNIRTSPYASGYRQTKNGNGKFAIFKDLATAAKATAYLLTHAGKDWRGYDKIVAALRRETNGSTADKQRQGLDFLTAIAMSKWNVSHYGAPNGEPWLNHLVKVWSQISGLPSLPAEKVKPKPAPKPKPTAPRDLNTNLLPASYIEPYASRDFYNSRHVNAEPLDGGL